MPEDKKRNVAVASALESVAATLTTDFIEGRRPAEIDLHDLVDVLLAVAAKVRAS